MLPTLARQIAWSLATFGPGPRTNGNTAHILKELVEVREQPTTEEWVDVAMLGFDGLWRAIQAQNPDASAEETARLVINAYGEKLAKNQGRNYPAPANEEEPVEHSDNRWKPTQAVFDVIGERRRQVEQEGWSAITDDCHDQSELAIMGALYGFAGVMKEPEEAGLVNRWFPFALKWWKPGNRRRNLVKGAASYVAEIERLDRVEAARKAKRGAATQ